MKVWAAAIVAIVSGVISFALIAGTAYLVFWHGESGWWWALTLLLLQGECISCYKLVNAILFGTPAIHEWMKVTVAQ